MECENLDHPPPSLRECLQVCWRGFNRWRRKYWLTRVIILLLLFAQPLVLCLTQVDFLLVQLTRIACESVLLSSEPQLVQARSRFYRAEELCRIQSMVRREIDANRNGVLEAPELRKAAGLGLAGEQLNGWVLDGDAEKMIEAAQRLELVGGHCTYQQIHRQARYAALGHTREVLAPDRRKLEAALAPSYRWPDFSKWQTWKRGLSRLVTHSNTSLLGDTGTVVVWFPACVLVAMAAGGALPSRGSLVGTLVGACLGLEVLFLRQGATWIPFTAGSHPPFALVSSGHLLLCGVAGHFGGTKGSQIRTSSFRNLVVLLLLGLLLLFWGLVPSGPGAMPISWQLALSFGARTKCAVLVLGFLIVCAACAAYREAVRKARRVTDGGAGAPVASDRDPGAQASLGLSQLWALLPVTSVIYGMLHIGLSESGGESWPEMLVMLLLVLPFSLSICIGLESWLGAFPLSKWARFYLFLITFVCLLMAGIGLGTGSASPGLSLLSPLACIAILVWDKGTPVVLRAALFVHSVLWTTMLAIALMSQW